MAIDLLDTVDITVDSTYNASTNPNFAADWAQFYFGDPVRKIAGFSLLWVNVPFTYHVIDATNNTFTLTVGATPYEIRLPYGTFNSLNFPNILQTSIAAAGVPNPTNFQSFVGTHDLKFVLYNSGSAFSLQFPTLETAHMLGFYGAVNTIFVSQNGTILDAQGSVLLGGAPVNYIQPVHVVNFQSCSTLKIWCSGLQGDSGAPARDINGKQLLLGIIPVNASYGGVINYTHEPQMIPYALDSLNSLALQVSMGDDRSFAFTNPETGTVLGSNFLPLNGQGFQVGIRLYRAA